MNDSNRDLEYFAKAIAVTCVRPFLEPIHEGKEVVSEAGDYSDVFIKTPSGTIPWNEAQLISESDMKEIMKPIVDRIFTFMQKIETDAEFRERVEKHTSSAMMNWDKPKFKENFLKVIHDLPLRDE